MRKRTWHHTCPFLKSLKEFARANSDSNVSSVYEAKQYSKELQSRRLHKSWDIRGEPIDSTNDERLSSRGEDSSELRLLRIRYKRIIDREHIRGSVDFEISCAISMARINRETVHLPNNLAL